MDLENTNGKLGLLFTPEKISSSDFHMLNTIAGLEGCFPFGMAQSLSVIIECNWCMGYVRPFRKHIRPCGVSRLTFDNMKEKEIKKINQIDFMAAVLPNGIPEGWEFFAFEANEYYQNLKIRRKTDAPGYDGWEYKTFFLSEKINDVFAYITLKKLGYRIPYDPFPHLIVR